MSANQTVRREQESEQRRQRRILRLPEVENITGKKRSGIYEGIADGSFPAPVPLGLRSVGWLEDEIEGWLEQRVAERDKKRTRRGAATPDACDPATTETT